MSENQELAPVTEVTPLANLPEALQAKIKATADSLKNSCAVAINRIAHQAQGWKMPDGEVVQSFTGIIVGIKHANIHYPGLYKKGIINPVDCFAVTEGDGDAACDSLSPHAMVEEPYGSTCATCPKFQWGSALMGSGKACAEHTLLAVNVPSLGDDIYLIEMKKGNSRIADSYIANTSTRYGHPIAVYTEFTIGRKAEWEAELVATANVNVDVISTLANQMDAANAMLLERAKGAYKSPTEPANDSEPEAVGRKARAR